MVLVPNESKAFSVDGIEIRSGSLSPLSGFAAPLGSIYLQNNGSNGAVFIKRGSADSDWNQLLSSIKNTIVVKKNPTAGGFSSIAAACNAITDSSSSNRYAIYVSTGTYDEGQIDVPPYVSILGSDIQATIVRPISNNQILFNINQGTEIAFMSLDNTSAGYTNVTGVMSDDKGNFSQMHKMSIYGFTTGVFHRSETQDSYLYMEYIDVDDVYSTGIKCQSNNGFIAYVNTENWYSFPNAINTGDNVLVDGLDATVDINAFGVNGSGSDNGIRFINGGSGKIQGGYFNGNNNAIFSEGIISGTEIRATGIDFKNNTLNINIDNVNTTGAFTGFSEYDKTSIITGSTFFITNKDPKIITVAKKGGDFSSVAAAVNSITDSGIDNRYDVSVGPGEFIEPIIDLVNKPYVSVIGDSISTTVIIPDDAFHHIIDLGIFNDVTSLTISGSGSGYAGIRMENQGAIQAPLSKDSPFVSTEEFSRIHRVTIKDCDIGIFVHTTDPDVDTMFYGEFVTVIGRYTNALKIINAGGYCACASMVHYTLQPLIAGTIDTYINGPGAALQTHACMVDGTNTNTAFKIENGAYADISATIMDYCDKAIHLPNVGTESRVNINGVTIIDSIMNLLIEHPTAIVSFTGTMDQSKISNASNNFSFNYLDANTKSIEVSNKLNMTFDGEVHTDLSTLLIESSSMGVMEGGELTNVSGLTINVADGFGYFEVEPEIIHRHDWDSINFSVPDNQESYIYFNPSKVLTANNTRPDSSYNILLGRVISVSGSVIIVDNSQLNAEHTINRFDRMFHDAIGPIFSSGSIVSKNVTPLHLDVTSGKYYFSMNPFTPSGGSNISFYEVYNNSFHAAVNAVKVKYDNAGTLTDPPVSGFVKHSLYVANDGANEKYLLVYGQETFSTQLSAESGNIPNPAPGMDDAIVLIANIIVQQGNSNIVEILDSRPRIGFKSSGTSSSTDHQALSNRDVEAAHPQYLLRNGNNAMTANLDLGGFTIINAGTLPGTATAAPVTNNADVSNTEGVSSFKARADHIHNIPTATPVTIGISNSQGTANTFAKSDHVHNHGNQTVGTHHAVATGSVNGFMSSSDKTKLDGIGGSRIIKSGLVAGSSFAGNPKTFAVVFSTAFPNTNYSIAITSDTNRKFTYSSKATTGFTINANANPAFAAGEVSWTAISTGETVE